MKPHQKTIQNAIDHVANGGKFILRQRCLGKKMTYTEYGKGFNDGYRKAVHTIYESLKSSHAAKSSPNIDSPIQGILDGLEIMINQFNEYNK